MNSPASKCQRFCKNSQINLKFMISFSYNPVQSKVVAPSCAKSVPIRIDVTGNLTGQVRRKSMMQVDH